MLSSCVSHFKWLRDSSCGGESSRVELVDRIINFDFDFFFNFFM